MVDMFSTVTRSESFRIANDIDWIMAELSYPDRTYQSIKRCLAAAHPRARNLAIYGPQWNEGDTR